MPEGTTSLSLFLFNQLSYPTNMTKLLTHRLMEPLIRRPQLATEAIGQSQIVRIVGGALAKSTCHLQSLPV